MRSDPLTRVIVIVEEAEEFPSVTVPDPPREPNVRNSELETATLLLMATAGVAPDELKMTSDRT